MLSLPPYGKVMEGYGTTELIRTLEQVTPVPEGVGMCPPSRSWRPCPLPG